MATSQFIIKAENVGTDKTGREQKHYVMFALSPVVVS